jgi:antitoxin YefM
MRLVNYSDARNSLKAVLDATVDDADVTVTTRRDGPDAVVMSLDQYNSIMATLHLLSNPANAGHLAKSIKEYRQAKARPRKLVAA